MSLRRNLLNLWLRRVEKPAMARAKTPEKLRDAFEAKARMLFHAPRGSRQIWHRHDHRAGSLDMLDILPQKTTTTTVILYIHGGAFVFGSPRTHAAMIAQLGHRLGARAVLPRYRLAPESAFPAALEDLGHAWDALLGQGLAPHQIVLGGDSAGGALALAFLGQLCAQKAAMPVGVFCFSPLTDMAHGGESFRTNAQREAVLPAHRAQELGQMYLNGQDVDDPRVSPIKADFHGACPVWLTVGDTEILRDDSRLMAAHLENAGVSVHFDEKQDLPHVWPIFHNILPEARQSLDDLAVWIRALPPPPVES
ncbi:MAG: acetyl esterase/lipase [Sulfitobacter sp.]|jgi:monoterpene epsilon-lactone hydrolase